MEILITYNLYLAPSETHDIDTQTETAASEDPFPPSYGEGRRQQGLSYGNGEHWSLLLLPYCSWELPVDYYPRRDICPWAGCGRQPRQRRRRWGLRSCLLASFWRFQEKCSPESRSYRSHSPHRQRTQRDRSQRSQCQSYSSISALCSPAWCPDGLSHGSTAIWDPSGCLAWWDGPLHC